MTSTPTAAIVGRFHALADTLTRNATILSGAGLPAAVVATRATVYRDVAEQVRMLADAEFDQAQGNPLVIVQADKDVAVAVARRFERLAGLLVATAQVLTTGIPEAVMQRRATVYRDVATQVRMLARHEVEQAEARLPRISRLPLSTATAAPNPVAARAASRAPRVRPAFLDDLVDAIAKRRRQGWSVARLTLWLRTSLRDPQTDAIHPCAERSFVAYVTSQLASPAAYRAA